jgi:antirestriction protein ArdC
MAEKTDVYKDVTDRIVAAVEAGPEKWAQTWTNFGKAGRPVNGLTGRAYSGINVLLLAFEGFADSRWYTFDQAMQAVGYKKNPEWKGKADTFKGVRKWIWTGEGEDPRFGVKKGEKGTHVVFWRTVEREEKDKVTGEKKAVRVPLARFYVVFNAAQIAGLPEAPPVVDPTTATTESGVVSYVEVARAFDKVGSTVLHGGDRACYSLSEDVIRLPEPGQFKTIANYWATRAHEEVHRTGHPSRLNRDLKGRFGTESYAMEELVAEIGAAFCCARLGISGEFRHPEYIANWLQVLKGDKYAIFAASREATKAADFLLGTGAEEEVDGAGDEASEAA